MRRHLLAIVLAGCSMQQSNGSGTQQAELKRVEKTEAPPPEKTAEKPQRPARVMTEPARVELAKLGDDKTPEKERIKAARQLAKLKDPAVVIPMMVMLGRELPEPLLKEIRAALVKSDARSVLIDDLTNGDDDDRALAADMLSRLKDPKAIEPLMKALADPHDKVRESAVGSLGIMGAKEAEAALIDRLEKDSQPDVRGAAAQALGMIKTEAATAALNKALEAEKDDFVKVLIRQGIATAAAK